MVVAVLGRDVNVLMEFVFLLVSSWCVYYIGLLIFGSISVVASYCCFFVWVLRV
jgi:hypothetical protein